MGPDPVTGAAGFLVETLFGLLQLVVLLRFLLQLLRADFYNPLSQFVVRVTNPVLVPLRRLIPGLGGLDMASLLLVLALESAELGILYGLVYGALPPMLTLLVLALAGVVELAIYVFIFAVLAQVILSWVNPGALHHNPMAGLLWSITEPLMRPARRVLPPVSGLDLSPILVFIVLNLARYLVVGSLEQLARSL